MPRRIDRIGRGWGDSGVVAVRRHRVQSEYPVASRRARWPPAQGNGGNRRTHTRRRKDSMRSTPRAATRKLSQTQRGHPTCRTARFATA
jgi:hypothetical protein